jgi:hypothetical protein
MDQACGLFSGQAILRKVSGHFQWEQVVTFSAEGFKIGQIYGKPARWPAHLDAR